jgi:hypothetical protein
MSKEAYVPGMCNINREEISYRRRAMWFGVSTSLALLVVLFALSINVYIRAALLLIPIYIAAIGYLQVRNRFCVSYAATGQQNAADGSTKAHAITERSARVADKRKARRMNLQALAATLLIALFSCVIPTLARFIVVPR